MCFYKSNSFYKFSYLWVLTFLELSFGFFSSVLDFLSSVLQNNCSVFKVFGFFLVFSYQILDCLVEIWQKMMKSVPKMQNIQKLYLKFAQKGTKHHFWIELQQTCTSKNFLFLSFAVFSQFWKKICYQFGKFSGKKAWFEFSLSCIIPVNDLKTFSTCFQCFCGWLCLGVFRVRLGAFRHASSHIDALIRAF